MGSGKNLTLGSLFAGIGGFDLGFEKAGWKTKWQVEIDPINRAVLADRFPHAEQFADIRECGAANLSAVSCITAGFPCQDVSMSGTRRKEFRGLRGEKTGLFFEAIRIIQEIQPAWVVLENVPGLLIANDGRDFETVLRTLADCGYVGFWRVLDAQYFGSPQRRRRVFLVGGFGRFPSYELLANASPVEGLSSSFGSRGELWCEADCWPGHTLQASNSASRITIGSELLVAEEDGWRQMAHRRRETENHGLCLGLDEANLKEAFAAGNAVCPQVAEWIARILVKS